MCVRRFAGYNTGACKQPAAVVYTLKLLIGAAPVAFIVTGLMILLLYPISEDIRLRNKLCLEELRWVELINVYLRKKNTTWAFQLLIALFFYILTLQKF